MIAPWRRRANRRRATGGWPALLQVPIPRSPPGQANPRPSSAAKGGVQTSTSSFVQYVWSYIPYPLTVAPPAAAAGAPPPRGSSSASASPSAAIVSAKGHVSIAPAEDRWSPHLVYGTRMQLKRPTMGMSYASYAWITCTALPPPPSATAPVLGGGTSAAAPGLRLTLYGL
jgi:hypothetical protein